MKFWMCALVLALMCGLVGSASAAKTKAAKPLKGKLVSVSGQTLTVETGKKGSTEQVKVEVDSAASITVDGTAVKTLAEIPAGAKLEISPATGKATSIMATSSKKRKKA